MFKLLYINTFITMTLGVILVFGYNRSTVDLVQFLQTGLLWGVNISSYKVSERSVCKFVKHITVLIFRKERKKDRYEALPYRRKSRGRRCAVDPAVCQSPDRCRAHLQPAQDSPSLNTRHQHLTHTTQRRMHYSLHTAAQNINIVRAWLQTTN